MSNLTALVDLDAMLHIIANVHWSAGNRTDTNAVKNHVHTFISNVTVNARSSHALMFYQAQGHQNFRNFILPEYKAHRTTTEAIENWKPTILEAFDEAGAIGLLYIESDDAIGIMANHLGYDRTVIITSDKDMKQIPALIYNPFKGNLKPEDRWLPALSKQQAEEFLYQQVLTGDPTDMPGSLCGIEKCGPKTAQKLLSTGDPYDAILREAYTKKYGEQGHDRCRLTYQMVKILTDRDVPYLTEEANREIDFLLSAYDNHLIEIKDNLSDLFEHKETQSKDVSDLFNNFKE